MARLDAYVNANKAIIQDEKLLKYALNFTHPTGKDKAFVFDKVLGYNQTNYKIFIEEIREGVKTQTPVFKKLDKWGLSFEVDMPIKGPNGIAKVRTSWIYDPGSEVPRLTSAYIKKKK